MLPDGELHVWQIPLDRNEAYLALLGSHLSTDERERAARYHFEQHGQRYIAGRGIVRLILSRYLSQTPQELAFVYGLRGKPALVGAPLQFNLAHSGGLAVLAVTRTRVVGIDIEQVRPVENWDGITRSFFSATECQSIRALPEQDRLRAFFVCWTQKEAYVKATGDGIGVPLDRFDVRVVPGEPPGLLRVEGNSTEISRWHFHELPLPAEYIGVTAHEGRLENVKYFRW